MNQSHLKQALQEAFGSKVFDDKMNDSLNKRIEQLKGHGFHAEEDVPFVAVRDVMGQTFSPNAERQVKERVKVLARIGAENAPPGPGMGETTPQDQDKVTTPFNDPNVKGNPTQESLTNFGIKGDVTGDVNATQKAVFEAGGQSATRGSGGNTPTGGVNSKVAAATNTGSVGPAGPGAGVVGNR